MPERALTDLELERLLAGELGESRARLATEADRARLEELHAEHAAFLAGVDVAAEAAAISRRRASPAERAPARRWRWISASGVAIAASVAAVAVVAVVDTQRLSIDDDSVTKGDTIGLIVHVAHGSTIRRVASGDDVQPGDRLRFEIGVPARGYIAILGIDGPGSSSVYYPFGGREPAVFDPRTGGLLPGAVALDATLGDERFYLVYSRHAFPIEAKLFDALRGGQSPPGVSVAEVVLRKTAPSGLRPVEPR